MMARVAKTLFIFLIIAGLASTAFAMMHENVSDHANCAVTKIDGAVCSGVGALVKIAEGHIDGLRTLMLAIFQSPTAGLLSLIFVVFTLAAGTAAATNPGAKVFGLQGRRLQIFAFAQSIRKQQRWTTLHERGAAPIYKEL